jgi:signal transduction histidine kinase
MFEQDAETVFLADLVDRTIEHLSYLDPELRTRLSVVCESDVAIRAPRAALGLIVTNLLENAIKYSPKGAPIDITVTATAVGLEPADRRRVFKMFHRSEQAVKKAIPGTGLGLYIVRTATRLLGGQIVAESEGRDLGSTFRVTLPINAEDRPGRSRASE